MIASERWQEAAIEALVRLLQPDEAVRALALFGAAAQPQPDVWSDIDLLLAVDEGAKERFHPVLDWLKPLGELYTWDQSAGPWTSVTRACFTDFHRIDFIITTEAALEQIDEWPHVPFWKGTRLLFSRSPTVDRVLARTFTAPPPPLISDEEFERMVNSFWFKGMLAVQKVMRDDRLIALHLALEMVRDCCVLGMLLRDRAEGTAHHRRGGSGNKVAARLEATRHPHTALGILDSLEQSSLAFDTLATQWSESYREQRGPLLEWISLARGTWSGNSET
jgi:predicted nucleotidyltransferase